MPRRVSTANPRVPPGLRLPENRRGLVNASLHEVIEEDRYCCSCDPYYVTTLCLRHSKALNYVWCPPNSGCPPNSAEFRIPEFREFARKVVPTMSRRSALRLILLLPTKSFSASLGFASITGNSPQGLPLSEKRKGLSISPNAQHQRREQSERPLDALVRLG